MRAAAINATPIMPVTTDEVSDLASLTRVVKALSMQSNDVLVVSAGSRQEAVTAFRSTISFKESAYAPLRVKPLCNNKLRVEFSTVEQRDETLARLRDSQKASAAAANKANPMIILKGISKDVTPGELIRAIKIQNPGIGDINNDTDIQLRFIRNNKNTYLYNAVLSIVPGLWRRALELERLNIDHQRVRAIEFTPFLQCHRCYQFGHTKKHCRDDAPAPCAHCASTAHGQADCPERERRAPPKCFNCANRNDKFNIKVTRLIGPTHLCSQAQYCAP